MKFIGLNSWHFNTRLVLFNITWLLFVLILIFLIPIIINHIIMICVRNAKNVLYQHFYKQSSAQNRNSHTILAYHCSWMYNNNTSSLAFAVVSKPWQVPTLYKLWVAFKYFIHFSFPWEYFIAMESIYQSSQSHTIIHSALWKDRILIISSYNQIANSVLKSHDGMHYTHDVCLDNECNVFRLFSIHLDDYDILIFLFRTDGVLFLPLNRVCI